MDTYNIYIPRLVTYYWLLTGQGGEGGGAKGDKNCTGNGTVHGLHFVGSRMDPADADARLARSLAACSLLLLLPRACDTFVPLSAHPRPLSIRWELVGPMFDFACVMETI